MNGFNITTNVLTIASSGTLKLQGGETISATVNLQASSTVVYTGTGASYTLKNYSYSNLTINGGSATVFSLPSNQVSLSTLKLTSGIFYLAGFNVTATTLQNDATLRLQGNESLSITNWDVIQARLSMSEMVMG